MNNITKLKLPLQLSSRGTDKSMTLLIDGGQWTTEIHKTEDWIAVFIDGIGYIDLMQVNEA